MSPLLRSALVWVLCVLGVLTAAVLLPGKLSIWVDENGRPVLTNQAPEGAEMLRPDQLSLGPRTGEPVQPMPRSSSNEQDRLRRELLAAREDDLG